MRRYIEVPIGHREKSMAHRNVDEPPHRRVDARSAKYVGVSVRDSVASFFSDHAIERCRLVVAVSGGFDSTALLLVMSELPGFEIIGGHVNHHLRGNESDEDERYVRALCERLKVECIVEDGTLDPERVKDAGIEAAAREVRHAKLKDIRERTNAKYVATAHQKNDQAETVLMRLSTGSGFAGLRG